MCLSKNVRIKNEKVISFSFDVAYCANRECS